VIEQKPAVPQKVAEAPAESAPSQAADNAVDSAEAIKEEPKVEQKAAAVTQSAPEPAPEAAKTDATAKAPAPTKSAIAPPVWGGNSNKFLFKDGETTAAAPVPKPVSKPQPRKAAEATDISATTDNKATRCELSARERTSFALCSHELSEFDMCWLFAVCTSKVL
jgi:hypothetical protein